MASADAAPSRGFGRLLRTTAFKLSMVYLILFTLVAGVILGYVGWNARRLLDAQIAETLEAEVNGLSEQYRIGGIRRLVAVVERRSRQPGSYLYLIQGPAGEAIAGNITNIGPLPGGGSSVREIEYQRIDEGDMRPRGALVRVFQLPGSFRLLVGRDLEERERLRFVMRRAFRFSLIVLVLVGVAGAFLVARRALRRIDAMTDTTHSIMAGNLAGRLPRNGSQDELDRLAASVNTMLARIEELMVGIKGVSDNIAHDLKTPLTRLRNTAEQALRGPGTDVEHRAALERVIQESDALIATFNALLLIARAEAGSGTDSFRPVDVSSLVADVGELYAPAAEDAGARLAVDVAPGLSLTGNRELLGQAIANLIDNALKYGLPPARAVGADVPQAVIALAAARVGQRLRISLADRGRGIAAADRARALERFQRLDASRSEKPGSGLGLSLAQAVARLHGGTITLDDNAPGLKVTLDLPAAAGA
jgi:hypothetical protein